MPGTSGYRLLLTGKTDTGKGNWLLQHSRQSQLVPAALRDMRPRRRGPGPARAPSQYLRHLAVHPRPHLVVRQGHGFPAGRCWTGMALLNLTKMIRLVHFQHHLSPCSLTAMQCWARQSAIGRMSRVSKLQRCSTCSWLMEQTLASHGSELPSCSVRPG